MFTKNIVTILFVLLFLSPSIVLSALSCKNPVFQPGGELSHLKDKYISVFDKEALRIVELNNIVTKLSKRHGTDSNISQTITIIMPNPFVREISELSMFSTVRLKTVTEARKFFFKNLNEILDTVNSNVSIRPILKEYPFNPEDIKLAMCFADSDKMFLPNAYIATVTLIDGRIMYSRLRTQKELLCVYSETYEDALMNLNSNANE